MRSFKVLLGSLLFLIVLLIVLAFKMAHEEPSTSILETTSVEVRPLMDREQIRTYRLRKQKLKQKLENYFERAIDSNAIVGVGVSIVQGDSILISKGYGKRSVDENALVNGKTVFRLGSLSKGFTGVLAASLQSEDKLDFGDRVVDYLPQFRLGDEKNTKKITLGHILSHTSGTPYHSYTNLVEAGLPVSQIAERFEEVNPISKPGEVYSYQNAMFALSQEVIKKALGDDITTALKERFFIPLDMTGVSMDYNTLRKAHNVALPHTRWRQGWKPKKLNDHYYNAVSAGGINASSLDMAKWMRFLLGHHSEIMPQSAIEDAFCPVIKIGYNNKYYQRWPGHKVSHYAYGWRIHTFEDDSAFGQKNIWHHGGSVNNYRNEIALFPQEDIGICVLFNSNSKLARHVIPDLYELVKEVYSDTAETIL